MENELNKSERPRLALWSKTSKASLYRIPLFFAASFVISLSSLLGYYSPFSSALIATLSGIDIIAALSGGILGLIVRGDFFSAVPFVICMLTISVFRLILGMSAHFAVRVSSSVICGAGICAANIIIAQKPTDMIIAFGFGVVSALAVFALNTVSDIAENKRSGMLKNPASFGAIAIVSALCICVLTSFDTGIVNMGIIAAACGILLVSRKYQYGGGAASAVAAFGLILADRELTTAAVMLAVAGVSCGLFYQYGKLSQAISFVFVSCVTAAVTGFDRGAAAAVAGVLIGAVVFVALPDRIGTQVQVIQKSEKSGAVPVFANRLNAAGASMSEIRDTIVKTAEILDRNKNNDIAWVYNSSCDRVCKNCRNNIRCWGDDFNDTVRVMNSVVGKLRKKMLISAEDFPRYFSEKCLKMNAFSEAMNIRYREYVQNLAIARKIAQMRELLTAELESVQKLLYSMSESMLNDSADIDFVKSRYVENILKEQGLNAANAIVSRTGGRMTVEAYGNGRLYCTDEQLCGNIAAKLNKEFELPNVLQNEQTTKIAMAERTVYEVQTEFVQISKGKECRQCGDYCDSFSDGRGNAYIIISDGMGSGARAKVDSAFACTLLAKLLKQGFDIEAALRFVNLALTVKSTDESFATLDICRIDLYTGKSVLFKAGGATTYIKCGMNVIRVQGKGIPLGIKTELVYETQTFSINDGDIIIMASDGAQVNENWICRELERSSSADSLRSLSQQIAQNARLTGEKGKEDDITVVGIRIKK